LVLLSRSDIDFCAVLCEPTRHHLPDARATARDENFDETGKRKSANPWLSEESMFEHTDFASNLEQGFETEICMVS
jgi:hypothetical protein